MDTKQKHKFKKFIKDLELVRGRHTELVSVYIPKNYDLIKVINQLLQEQGTASNIKDKTTKKHVIDSLEKIVRHLRLFKKLPENGLAVFAGNIAEKEGQTDIKVFSVEPIKPLTIRLYRCDQRFVLEPLNEMIRDEAIYGLMVIDKREASIGLLKGTAIEECTKLTSGVPGKARAGGQSARRFESLREIAAKDFYGRIGDVANREFSNIKKLKGILIGGPGMTKNEFLDGSFLHTELKEKVVAVEDLSYTGEFGLQELVEKSKGALAKEEITAEKEIMKRFFELLGKETGKVAYGVSEVKKTLAIGAVEVLLLSEDLEDEISKELEEQAEAYGAEVKIISVETGEGKQLKDLGGIAAILRFAIS